jgi:8-hydroxy-5-deazaflavin:NADPH oxidoreductase
MAPATAARIAVLGAGHVGKLVVDAMNYWPPVDGVQELFEDDRRPVGSPDRRALGVAGDDPAAVEVVAELVERIGYDSVRLESLGAGRLLEPGGPVFGVALRRPEFELALRAEATT